MQQHDTSSALVDILSAVSAGTNEGFFNVHFTHSERGHALGELGLFVGHDGSCVHGGKVADECSGRNGMSFLISA